VIQQAGGPLAATTNLLNFDGIGSNGFIPPDDNASVGATQIIQQVNSQVAIFSKTTGALLLGPINTNTLFSNLGSGSLCVTTNNGDGIVLYDKLAGRWLISQFAHDAAFSNNLECVAISTSSDATGTYHLYSFSFGTVFNDYPKFGVWPDAYYLSTNLFPGGGNAQTGEHACALDRAAMLAGNTPTSICFSISSTISTLLPSDLDGFTAPPIGEPDFFVQLASSNSLNLWKFHVDFLTPSNSTFTGPITIPVAPFTEACGNGGTCIPQLGTTQLLESAGDRLMFRLAYRNFGGHESLVVNHTVQVDPTTGQTGVRWYEIRDPNGTPAIFQQSTFAPDSNFRWMSSIAMDRAGDMAMGYSVSSSAINPEIHYTGRLPTDPLNTMETEATIIDGMGSQPPTTCGPTPCGHRWGDYTSMSIDPVDDCTFWYTNEYLTTSGINWQTRIANFKFPACGTFPLIVTLAGPGNGTVTSSPPGIDCPTICSANFNSGTMVTLTATQAPGSTFAGWSGACTGTGSCSVTMTTGMSATVTFNMSGPAVASLSPTSLFLGTLAVGTSGPQGKVTLTNTGGSGLAIASIMIAGANSSDFSLSHSCPLSPNTLGVGAACVIRPTFTPSVSGPRKSSISITDNAGGSPQTVILTGVGSGSGPSPTSLSFGSQTVGTSSAAQTVTFTNTRSVTMNLWQIAILGANAGDFSQTNTCGGTLGAGANCAVNVTFTPSATGTRTASLLFSDDGGASPQAVTLTGGAIGMVIALPQIVSGNLSNTAPNAHCNFGSPADRWSFTLSAPTTVTIALSSSAFDTFVCLFDSTNNLLVQDDDSGGNLNSQATISLPLGKYFIEATSFSGSGTGNYTLSLQSATIASPGPISVGQTVVGNLSTSAPKGQCKFGSTPVDRYSFSFNSPPTTTLTIDLASSAFDTFVCLLNSANQVIASDDNQGSGTNSRLVVTLTTGSYFIEVTTQSSGGTGGIYTLSLQSGLPPHKPIILSQTLSGNLSSTAAEGQCKFGSTPVVRYGFTLPATTTLTIDLASPAFDTFVCLLNSANQVIISDDNSGPGTNSRLVVTLPAGSYFIEVTTQSPGFAGGPYTLSVQPGFPPATPITVGQTLSGNLSSTAAEGQCEFGSTPVDRYMFSLPTTTTLTIDLASPAFDTFVCLLNSANQSITSDDNQGPGTNSRLVVTLPAGSYFIEVTTQSPGFAGGPYTLSVQPGLPPATPITVGQTLSGNLSSTAAEGQCKFGSTPVDRYMFSLPTTTTLTIDLASPAFDTFVCLLNSVNQVITSDDNSGPGTNSRLVVTLPVGSYFIEVTTQSPGFVGGPYTLSVQPGLPPATPITVGQTLSGNLSSTAAEGQCKFGSTPVDRYGFTLSGTTTLTIDLASSAFDTFVCLLNSANQVINSDDNGGGGTNSRLVVTLLAGSYFIEVTTQSPGFAGGPYTLFLH